MSTNMFKSENSEIVTNAIEYVKSSCGSSEISVETVAEQAGFTPNYFNKVFIMHTGFSIMKYVRFERLCRAAKLLRNTDKDIIEIALDCGYESHEGFIRSFKQQYDLTPIGISRKEKEQGDLLGRACRRNPGRKIPL